MTMKSIPRLTVALGILLVPAGEAFVTLPRRGAPATSGFPRLEAARLPSPSSSSCRVDDVAARDLRFDLVNLMRRDADEERRARKTEALLSIHRACEAQPSSQPYSPPSAQPSAQPSSQPSSQPSIRPRAEVAEVGESGRDDSAVLPEELARLRWFLCASPHARDHRGKFRVFAKDCNLTTGSATTAATTRATSLTLPANVLFSQDHPIKFLRDSLSYRSEASVRKRGGMMYDSSEAVVWCTVDGVNNSGRDELGFVSRVLDHMPFAHLNLGGDPGDDQRQKISIRDYDDDDEDKHSLSVVLESKTVADLESMGVLLRDHSNRNADCDNGIAGDNAICCRLKSDDLAIIETILCRHNELEQAYARDKPTALREQQQSTILKLISAAVDNVRNDPLNKEGEPHLVLLAHSISASAVATAITTWKRHEIEQKRQSKQRVEDLLHQALTVVTFGNVCRSFCDGPAYIHVSMCDDPWTSALGSTGSEGKGDRRGGRGAVHFRACSPYENDQTRWDDRPQHSTTTVSSMKAHNAHNLSACLVQYLSLLMRINGMRSFRALYDDARFVDPTSVLDINPKHFAVSCNQGDLVVPPHLDDWLLPAMIRATGGDRWLWRADGDVDEEVLPDEIETRSHLEEQLGYGIIEEICDA